MHLELGFQELMLKIELKILNNPFLKTVNLWFWQVYIFKSKQIVDTPNVLMCI